jgi:hypothetical protein
VEEEWIVCINIWDSIKVTNYQCQLHSLGPLEIFYPLNQVLEKFEHILQQHGVKVWNVFTIKLKIKTFLKVSHKLLKELRKSIQLKYAFFKIDKYIKMFNKKFSILKTPAIQHTFPHGSLSNMIFESSKKYDKEVLRKATQRNTQM